MNLLEKMLRRKSKSRPTSPSPFSGTEAEQAEAARQAMEALRAGATATVNSHRFPKLSDAVGARSEVLTKTVTPTRVKDGGAPVVNIWDIEEDAPGEEPERSARQRRGRATSAEPEAAVPVADPAPRGRANRTKTRMLGFEPEETSVVPLFEAQAKPEEELEPAEGPEVVMFPTGWLVVKAGAGRGASFPLKQGLSMVGRGVDQTVRLDFGDMTVSRSNHAAIAYDASQHQFFIGHGGKSNLVRLNGRPLLTTEPLKDGDEIQIGETTLLLKVLCTPEFNWSRQQGGGDSNDMAIA
ncbi:FHA domain-containing protein [Tabrizicola sp. BL-A-41-H6]|uniref:FHA domain-containing protein n=1 Tax=Tabrizicola sp. BL-A-41-H6 TaxID=3421107 RepID=UPI003D66E8C1